MTPLNEITLTDIRTVERIANLKVAGRSEVLMIQEFGRKYIDNKMKICNHCSGQIRFGWSRVKNFYKKNKEIIDDRKEELTKDNLTCMVCSKATKNRRYKYCSDVCKSTAKLERDGK
tara:strand:- start:6 stop:356 length:351 start_codon:yes stop_codon:yes gene_type:complete